MIRRFFLPVTLFVASSIPVAGEAQEIPSAYRFVETRQEASAYGGRGFADPGIIGIGPESGTLIGARYLVEVGGAIGFEFDTSYLQSSRQVLDPRRDVGDQFIGEAQIDVLAIDALLRLNLTGHRTWRGVQPYIGVGGGLAFEALKDRTLEEAAGFLPADVYEFNTRFTAAVAGGLSFHLSRRLTLRAEGTFNLWKIAAPSGFLDATRDIPLDATTIPPDDWVAVKGLTVGLGWRF